MSTPMVDPGLMTRFRAAGALIAWRDAPAPSEPVGRSGASAPGASARIAHLHDEEARVEQHETGTTTTVIVDSGPVGALVLLLEIERRGPATRLVPHSAGDLAGFPQGAIEGRWTAGAEVGIRNLPMRDLVGLARYALV
jgi:hypothetical protein